MTVMKHFKYKGIDQSGQKVAASIEAPSLAIAKLQLYKQGIRLSQIVKKRPTFFKKKGKGIKTKEISLFSRQLATLIETGIPLAQCLEITSQSRSNESLVLVIKRIKEDVESGLGLAEAFSKHPHCFDELSCSLLHVGEQSGSLDILLDNLAGHLEKMERIKTSMKKASTYPLAIILISCLVSLFLLVLVVPQFESLFKSFGAELPWPSRILVQASQWLFSYWHLLLALLSILVYSFFYAKAKSLSFKHKLDLFLLKIPILGPILKKACTARFTRSLSICFAAGLTISQALKVVANASGHILFAEGSYRIKKEIATGLAIHLAMEKTQLFSPMVVQMIKIGEESGALEKILNKVADFFEEEVDNALEIFTQLLEPLIVSILGILLGGLVIALYLPIFKLGSVI